MCTAGYKGKVLYIREFKGFTISETIYSPLSTIAPHSHKCPILSIILNGSLTELYDNKKIELSYLNLIYKPASEMHSNRIHSKGARCLNIQLSNKWIDYLNKTGLNTDHVLNSSTYLTTSILSRLRNELNNTDKYSETILEGLITELFADLIRLNNVKKEKPTMPKWLENITKYMDNLPDDNISVSVLANIAGIHPVHFINTFRKFYNTTPAEYLRQKKIDSICKELSTTDKSMLDIVFQFNFTDQSHFIKFFKKYIGLTPSKYINMYRN